MRIRDPAEHHRVYQFANNDYASTLSVYSSSGGGTTLFVKPAQSFIQSVPSLLISPYYTMSIPTYT